MFFIFVILLMTTGYTLMLYFLTDLSPYFLFAWVPAGFVAALITLTIVTYICLQIGARTSHKGRFRHFALRNAVFLALKAYHVKLNIIGKDNIPSDTYIVYSNHKSNMDPLFIYYALKSHTITAIGKDTLFKNHFMKLIGKTFGAYPLNRENDREAAKTMINAIKGVKDGTSIIIFPEGGIKTRDVEEMVNLRAGAYKLVTKTGAAIVPCAIVGSSHIKGQSRFKTKRITVVFFKPILKEEYQDMNTTNIGLMVEDIINEGIKNYGKEE